MGWVKALRSVLCWLSVALNLLLKFSDFLKLPVVFFVVLTSWEHLVGISPLCLTQSKRTAVNPVKDLVEQLFGALQDAHTALLADAPKGDQTDICTKFQVQKVRLAQQDFSWNGELAKFAWRIFFETWAPKLQLTKTLLLSINHISCCAQDHMLFHHQQDILHVLV